MDDLINHYASMLVNDLVNQTKSHIWLRVNTIVWDRVSQVRNNIDNILWDRIVTLVIKQLRNETT